MGSRTAETPGASTVAGSNAEIKTALIGSNKAIGYLGLSYVEDSSVVRSPWVASSLQPRPLEMEAMNFIAGCTFTPSAMPYLGLRPLWISWSDPWVRRLLKSTGSYHFKGESIFIIITEID